MDDDSYEALIGLHHPEARLRELGLFGPDDELNDQVLDQVLVFNPHETSERS
jgi:hypothetical protein